MTDTETETVTTIVDVVLPEMGESITEGTITRWLVAVGDTVELDQPIVEISTDKVDAELPSPAAGTITAIFFEEDADVTVDTVIATISTTDGAPQSTATAAAQVASPESRPSQKPQTSSEPQSEAPRDPLPPSDSPARVFATPVAHRIASRENVDLAGLRGSGVRGRITRSDVLRALDERGEAGGREEGEKETTPSTHGLEASEASAAASAPSAFADHERVDIQPMSRIRRLTAEHMMTSLRTSAHVTTVFHADFTHVVEARNRYKESFREKHGTKLTYMPFLFRAVIGALRAHRQFNASVYGTDIVFKKDIHLGIAVATERGLMVPVIHDADRLDLAHLAKAANDLAERARAKKLKPDDVTRGTFTITNPGVFGSLFGTPIIHQPQVAILCVGTIEKRPVVVSTPDGEDALVIRPMGYLALTYDHRLIDGSDAEYFMTDVLASLANDDYSELEE